MKQTSKVRNIAFAGDRFPITASHPLRKCFGVPVNVQHEFGTFGGPPGGHVVN